MFQIPNESNIFFFRCNNRIESIINREEREKKETTLIMIAFA